MSGRTRSAMGRAARPLLGRLDRILTHLDELDERLQRIERRLEDMDTFVAQTGARVSTVVERSRLAAESEARTARRINELERLLGASDAEG